MSHPYDVAALGNAIVDVIAPATDAFLDAEALVKGSMMLVDTARADALYGRMGAAVETSGGSAGNTVAGVASFGGRAIYVGKVADDALGRVFRHDITAIGVRFDASPLGDGPGLNGAALGTGRCLVNVTPDGQRTMCTYLGAANALSAEDVAPEVIEAARIVYLEGYLFDPPAAREAFAKAAAIGRRSGCRIALTLSDAFVVERHRQALLDFIADEVDIVFANEAEVAALHQTEDFDEAVRALADLVQVAAVTRGGEGSVMVSKQERVSVPAEPVDRVVDTTGAGDQYAAGVLYGLARDLPLQTCARLGSIAAAEVIGHYGPRPQSPLKSLAAAALL